MEINVSIITINYNGLDDTCALLDTLPFNDDLEVIVVDNASKEDEASIIEKRYPSVKVIRSKDNLGFAGGNNLGIKAAQGKYLFFINNDTIFKDFQDVEYKKDKLGKEFKKMYDLLVAERKKYDAQNANLLNKDASADF